MTALSAPVPPVPKQAIDDAMTALIARQRQARETVWVSPSRGQVRALLEGAYPGLVTAAARAVAEMERAEKAEARLAEIATLCRNPAAFVGRVMGAGRQIPGDRVAARVLAIIGSQDGETR